MDDGRRYFCFADVILWNFGADDWSDVEFDQTCVDGIMLPDLSLICRGGDFRSGFGHLIDFVGNISAKLRF